MATDGDEAGRWEHWLVHLLWATSTRTSALGEAALAGGPLSLAGVGLLENVYARPGITIADLTRRVPQTQQTISQVVARLEKHGLIERRLLAGNRRIGLFLTDAGAEAREHAHGSVEALESWLRTELGERRHQRLVTLLEEAKRIIGDLESPSAPPQSASS